MTTCGSIPALTLPLKYERDQAPDPLTVPCIFIRKLLAHEFLFSGRLQIEGNEREPEADECADLSHCNSGPGKGEQETRIHRMSHQLVRPAQNQFVILLNRDHGAPVRSETSPGPDGESAAAHCGGQSQPLDPGSR